ncbi:MAG: hypothetical protein Q9195_008287 [Heterodermia aff. obscurata]
MSSPAPTDVNDFDRYINFDQAAIPSPSFSPVSGRPKSFNPSTSMPSSTSLPIQPSSQPLFAPPSHQYEEYSNLNGLPVGALSETYSVNQASQNVYSRQQSYYLNPTTNSLDLNTGDDFGFNNGSGYTYSQLDMDLDFGSTPQSLLTPVDGLNTDFVDPAAIGGQDTTLQPPKRAYPGMHQQQAALAKAQAEQKQKELQEQKAKEAAASSRPAGVRPGGSTSRPPTDPIVEEKISQLLSQMRHNSVGSSNEDDALTPTASGNHSHGSRMKKDEDDMDEDERLLASEEGKKLSSKERRQLRNKVSARAFQYIGQLEGEIAAKTAEADDLRAKNDALMSENAQLHELTRSLLSSPAFSEFLKEAGAQAPVSAPTTNQTPVVKSEPTPQPTKKDVNPNSAVTQTSQSQQFDTPYIGMTMIPEHPVDLNTYESNTDSWANNMDFSLYDQQVFAVTSLPEGPAIDQLTPVLKSDKPSSSILPLPTSEPAKNDAPVIAKMPSAEVTEPSIEPVALNEDVEFDESDPAFALFSDCPASTKSSTDEVEEPIFGNIQLEKAFGRVELIVENESINTSETDSATLETFQRLCSSLDELSERISLVVPHQ